MTDEGAPEQGGTLFFMAWMGQADRMWLLLYLAVYGM